MEIAYYEKNLIVLRHFTKSEEAVTPKIDFSDKFECLKIQILVNISPVLFYASETWHPQKSDLTKMQCFYNGVLKWVTPGRHIHD